MDINKELFYLLKNHKYDDFKKILNNKININLQDEYNNTLIHYAIIFNQEDIIKILLSLNCKIDYLDTDGKTILYHPIKYGYNNILNILFTNTNNIIGIPINNIKDKSNNSSLHYAVLYNNIEAIKLLLLYNVNINNINNDGNTALFIAVQNNNINIIKILLDNKNIKVNLINNNSLSVLHIAIIKRYISIINIFINDKRFDLNIVENKYGMSPLMYLLDINYKDIIIQMLNNGAKIDHQDIYGNNILHHSLIENKLDIYFFLRNYKYSKIIDNHINIKGSSPLHILLENFNNIDISSILNSTKLNIQDNNGNTCLHLICKNNLWKKYKDILINKKTDIYIYNLENQTPLVYINDDEYDEFIELISHSYYNSLKRKPKQWKAKWENDCSTIEDKDKCLILIKENIKKLNNSIPMKKNYYNIDIQKLNSVKYNTFIGVSLDVISCCIYIAKNLDIYVPLNHDLLDNTNFNNYLNNMKIVRYYDKTDFYDIEILWIQQHIYISEAINKAVENYIISSKKLMAIPIGIELSQGSHANILIINKEKNIAERFEPSGKDHPIGFFYNSDLLDKYLHKFLKKYFKNITYLKPKNFLPKISFQLFDNIEEHNNKNIGDPDGFCLSWCFWYISEKSKYLDLDSEELVKKLIIAIKRQNLHFRTVIRDFTKFITDIRDDLLIKNKIDINDWINNNITDEQIIELNNNIKLIVQDLNL